MFRINPSKQNVANYSGLALPSQIDRKLPVLKVHIQAHCPTVSYSGIRLKSPSAALRLAASFAQRIRHILPLNDRPKPIYYICLSEYENHNRSPPNECDFSALFRPNPAADSQFAPGWRNVRLSYRFCVGRSATYGFAALVLSSEGPAWSLPGKEGLWMHYRLTPAHSKSHEMLLACLAQSFREESSFCQRP